MEQKKYKILKDNFHIQTWDGKKFYTIKALIDIPEYGVKAGDLGGGIESEANLSQKGSCWIAHYGFAYGNARVYEDAFVGFYCEVKDNAKVHGHAQIKSESSIREDAEVYGRAEIHVGLIGGHAKVNEYARVDASENLQFQCIEGNCHIHGHARVSSYAYINGEADISGHASVAKYAKVSGKTRIDGNAAIRTRAEVSGNAHIGGDAVVYELAVVSGNADITGTVEVAVASKVSGNAVLSGDVFVHETVSVGGNAKVTQGRLARDWFGEDAPPPYWVATWGHPSLGLVCYMRNTGGICSNCDEEVKEEGGHMPLYCPSCGLRIEEIISAPHYYGEIL